MEKPIFSVIVPFYNKERSLEACIKSLLAQDFPKDNYEIIFIDNNSTDKSAEIIAKFPSLKLLQEKRQNAYAARNKGIAGSSGIFAVFTDADAQAPVNWLSNIRDSLNENSYDILIGWYIPARPVKLLEIHSLLVSERIKKALAQNNPSMLTACAANLAVKKEIFEKEGLFLNNSNSEDMYFTIRCLQKGYNIGFADNIKIKRNDVDSIKIFLLKNFIYGCSNALDIKDNLSFPGKLKYIFITVKFIFKYFPLGAGLLLFTLSYFTGYFLGKSGLLKPRHLSRLVYKYTDFISKNAV